MAQAEKRTTGFSRLKLLQANVVQHAQLNKIRRSNYHPPLNSPKAGIPSP